MTDEAKKSWRANPFYGVVDGEGEPLAWYTWKDDGVHWQPEALLLILAAPAMLAALKALTTPRYTGDFCPWCGTGNFKTPFEGHGESCPLLPAVDLIAAVEKGA